MAKLIFVLLGLAGGFVVMQPALWLFANPGAAIIGGLCIIVLAGAATLLRMLLT